MSSTANQNTTQPETLAEQLQRFTQYIESPGATWEPFDPRSFYVCNQSNRACFHFFNGWMSDSSVDEVNVSRQILDTIVVDVGELPASSYSEVVFQRMITSPNAKPPKKYPTTPPDANPTAEIDGELLELRRGPVTQSTDADETKRPTE